MVGAPISEMHGRRPVYISSVLCFTLFVLGAGFSTSLVSLIVCRFFAGVFGGSALVVGFGLLSDIWGPSHLPIALSIFNTIPFCGPAIG
jgi:MFS family permease